MYILEGEKVTRYFGGLAAVDDVDFYIDQGEVVGLIPQRCRKNYVI